jgi:NTP pyrophosphatase (non-canonical NTP hydrolase)
MMDINELVKIQEEFDSKHRGNFSWNEKISQENIEILEHLIVSVVGEVGELANITKKIVRGDITYDDAKENITEEVVDIFIYVIKLCYQIGIDVEKSYLEKLKINEVRFKGMEHQND